MNKDSDFVLTDRHGQPVEKPAVSGHVAGIGTGSAGAGGAGVGLANQSPVRNRVQPIHRLENRQLTGRAWREVVHKTSTLEANNPWMDGCLVRMADYRGAVTPYPATADLKYNRYVQSWLEETFYNDPDFDASGKFTLEGFQKQMWRYHDRDGDCLAVSMKDPDNRMRPVWRLFPALGVDSPQTYGTEWIDGVKVGAHHKALAYHVLAEESEVQRLMPLSRAGYEVDRANACHFANWRAVGRARGTTVFLSSGNTVIDLAMLKTSMHTLAKLASMIAMTFEREKGAVKPQAQPMHGRFAEESVPPAGPVVDAAGKPIDIQAVREEIMGEGGLVMDLEPGETLKLNSLDMKGLDVGHLRGQDLEDVAMAYGVPVQILFCIYSGVFNLTGPGFRVALSSALRWREGQLRRIEPFVMKAYAEHVAWGLRTKQIPYPVNDFRPLLCKTRWEKVIGIDEGRDVNMDLIRLQIGATDEAEIAHEYGRRLEDVIESRAGFILEVCKKMGWKPTPEMWASGWKAAGSGRAA